MKITREQNGSTMTVALEGRLDSTGAIELENVLRNDDVLIRLTELTLNFSRLEYVSSAGLRVLRNLYVDTKGIRFRITNMNETVREVFDVTGFSDLLTTVRAE